MPDNEKPSQSTEGESVFARMMNTLRPSRSRGQIIVGVLLAIVGFLFVVQVRNENDKEAEFAGARRDELLQLLDSLDAAAARAEAEIATLESRKDELETDTGRRQAAVEAAREQVKLLGLLAGTLPAEGRGIQITINDPEGAVGASTIVNTLEELRDAGAEAIEINNRARVVAQSPVQDAGNGISVNDVELQPPYLIEAIGDPHTLGTAVQFEGGIQDQVEALQGTVLITPVTDEDLLIESLYSAPEPDYASPAEEEEE